MPSESDMQSVFVGSNPPVLAGRHACRCRSVALSVMGCLLCDPHAGLRLLLAGLTAALLSACQPEAETAAPQVRPVRTVTVVKRDVGETVSYTGRIQAENETRLAFRISGRMVERPINVGDHVEPGQVVAKLEPQDELNALRTAQASVCGGTGTIEPGAEQLRSSENAAGQRHCLARAVRASRVGVEDRACAAGYRRGAVEGRQGSGQLHRIARRCRRYRRRDRRRAWRGGAGRAD